MIMQMHVDGTAKTLDKRDGFRLDCGSWDTTCDGLIHIILTNRGADDGMDLRGQVL